METQGLEVTASSDPETWPVMGSSARRSAIVVLLVAALLLASGWTTASASKHQRIEQGPILIAPADLELVTGTGFFAAAEASDADSSASLSGKASVPLEGLTVSSGRTLDGKLIVTVSGSVPVLTPEGRSAISWSVKGGHSSSKARTTIRIVHPVSMKDLAAAVQRFSHHSYVHGVPTQAARRLGPDAVPILCAMLRDPREHPYWPVIAEGIAIIGTPESFDTLKAFVWDRFSGVVDAHLDALIAAHAAIGDAAPTRPDVLDYLVRTSDGAAWERLPWRRSKAMGSLVNALCQISVSGSGAIPTAKAHDFLLKVQKSSPGLAGNAREALEYQELVIRLGQDGASTATRQRLH
jgi:hypothetical protein